MTATWWRAEPAEPDRVGSEHGAHARLPMDDYIDFVVETVNFWFCVPELVFSTKPTVSVSVSDRNGSVLYTASLFEGIGVFSLVRGDGVFP